MCTVQNQSINVYSSKPINQCVQVKTSLLLSSYVTNLSHAHNFSLNKQRERGRERGREREGEIEGERERQQHASLVMWTKPIIHSIGLCLFISMCSPCPTPLICVLQLR